MKDKLKSVWENDQHKTYCALNGDETCEILVVGGGLVGQLCAYYLSERGHQVLLVEADMLNCKTTANTTAAITSQQGVIYGDIQKKYGLEFAKSYFLAQEEGIYQYKLLIDKYNIECDFKLVNGYFYSQKSDLTEFKNEFSVLQQIGADAAYLDKLDKIHLNVNGVIKQSNQAQFDPLKFLSALPRKYKIYEHTRIKNIDLKKCIASTGQNKIKADKIVIATRYPILNKCGLIFSKLYQSMSYATAFSNVGNIDGIYNDDNEDGITLRNYNDMLIVGGIDHRTGRKNDDRCFARLEVVANELYPSCQIVTSWLAEDCVTYDHLPLVGNPNKSVKNVYIATGFNKWGMANSIMSANLISDLIDNKQNKLSTIFSPQRDYILRNFSDFTKGMMISISNLCKSYFTCAKKNISTLANGDGGIFTIGGKKRAVYKDLSGKLHIISARCSHLGCQLEFNKEATSWDCPCHGSRFDIDGNILNDPAVIDVHNI
ncbi:MAG: FAD-dependent oxidoreductase [Clostridia bacterium]